MQQRFYAYLWAITLVLGYSFHSNAQEVTDEEKANHFSAGFSINNHGGDFGWGVNFTSPFFAKKRLAIRTSANYQYFSHIPITNDTTEAKEIWSPYGAIRLGFVSSSGVLLNTIRLYSETGATLAISNNAFSTKTLAWGAYSVFGFEFLIRANEKSFGSYFTELGWIGVAGRADRMQNDPLYSNGFFASVGFRTYF